MNKRTQILKQMTSEKMSSMIESQPTLTLNLPVDLIDQNNDATHLLHDQIATTAEKLKINSKCLKVWFDTHPKAPLLTKISLLRLIERYDLDLFLEEVDLVQYEDQSWQAVITTHGYARLINTCPQFKGLNFTYSDTNTGVCEWVECAIYRSDRDGPIMAREYYNESKRDSIVWQKMPRRMLRNRAFQQCAKMALGI